MENLYLSVIALKTIAINGGGPWFSQAMLFVARTPEQFPVAYEPSLGIVDFPSHSRSSEKRLSVLY
jgi:hypothetical protein